MTEMKKVRSIPRPILAVAAVSVLAATLAVLFHSITWRTGDDGRYYVLGQSIASGLGLRQFANPTQPPETITPPLYPALLAAVIRISRQPIIAAKTLNNVLYVLSAFAMAALLAKTSKQAWIGALSAGMGMFAVGFASFASYLMSDMLFIALVYAVLWLDLDLQEKRAAALLLGICAGLAWMTRMAGVALAAALLLNACFRRRWAKLFWVGLGISLVAAPWFIWKYFILKVPEDYIQFAEVFAQSHRSQSLGRNFPLLVLSELVRDLPRFVFSAIPAHFLYNAHEIAFSGTFWKALAGLIGAGSAAGFARRIKCWNSADLFCATTLGLVAAIPGYTFEKYYLFPVLPLFAFYFFEGARWAAESLATRAGTRWIARMVWTAAIGAGVFSLLIDFGAGSVHFMKERARSAYGPWAPERFRSYQNEYDAAWAGVSEAAAWIASNTPPNALVMSRKPDHLYVMCGRQGWRYEIPKEVGRTNVMDSVRMFSAERQVLFLEDAFPTNASPWGYGNNRRYALDETVRAAPDKWQLVFSSTEPITRVWAYAP